MRNIREKFSEFCTMETFLITFLAVCAVAGLLWSITKMFVVLVFLIPIALVLFLILLVIHLFSKKNG